MKRALALAKALFSCIYAVNPPCLQRADGTANVRGRVGHCHFYKKRASVTEALFSCIYAVNPPLSTAGRWYCKRACENVIATFIRRTSQEDVLLLYIPKRPKRGSPAKSGGYAKSLANLKKKNLSLGDPPGTNCVRASCDLSPPASTSLLY